MSKRVSMVPLGEILKPISRPESVDPGKLYRILGAHWYAEGLYIKDTKLGSGVQADKLYRIEQGDFVYNRLFAWKGSFAIAAEEDDGCYVSNEFPIFTINQDRVSSQYLRRYFCRASVWEEALSLSSGGTPTSRNRLKEDKLLSMEIPLPPLQEQQRIVARIEELAGKIEEARRLYAAISKDIHRTLVSEYNSITKDAKRLPMKEVAPLERRPIQVELEKDYYELGIRSFGKGTFHKAPVTGAALGTKHIFRIEENDLLFNIVFAWEGALAVAKPKDHGRVGSHRFLTCVPKKGLATASFLCFHFLTERGLQQLLDASPGSAGRNRTLGIKALEEILVPIPPFEKQLWFDALQERFNQVKNLRAGTIAELDALLPSILDKAFKGKL